MDDQVIRVQTPAGIAEFPAGTDPKVIEQALAEQFPSAQASHEAPDEHPHARTWRKVKENAPMIGAAAATLAGPGGLIPSVLLAGGGGYLGARVRGDSRDDAAAEGVLQGGLQGAGGVAVKGGQAVARGLMKGTVPKTIAKNFDQIDIPAAMLKRGAVPGVGASARRINRLSTVANAERDAAAATVPPLSRRKIIEGLRPIHQKMTAAREPELADSVLQHMRDSARNIGREGLSGPQALARKDVKQAMGKASLNAADPRTAAMGSQLNDMERGAIVSHLRETPRMAKALDESQTLMAIDQVMQDAALSNPVTRARIGGLPAAALSPVGLGLTSHAVNQGSKAFDPNVARLLMALMNQRSEQE
jgi:hypothetical protein